MIATNATIQPDLDAAVLPQPRKRRVPSERNRHVYAEVVLRQRPQPEVAKEFGITQQRVSQIVEQFQAWLAENLPQGAEAMTGEEQLRLAANTAYLQQQHAYGEAMRKHRRSCEDKHGLRIRYSAQGKELWRETVCENQNGKSGFLSAAIRACTQKWKIVHMAHGLLSRGMDVEWLLAQDEPDDRYQGDGRKPMANQTGTAGNDQAGSASQAGSAIADPPPSAATDEASKVLCNSDPVGANELPLAPPAPAITPVASPVCTHADDRKLPLRQVENLFAKSCAASLEEGLVLPRKRQSDEPAPLSAADRRASIKARQKQLARWQASRACKAG